jgi:hypothetical protein
LSIHTNRDLTKLKTLQRCSLLNIKISYSSLPCLCAVVAFLFSGCEVVHSQNLRHTFEANKNAIVKIVVIGRDPVSRLRKNEGTGFWNKSDER